MFRPRCIQVALLAASLAGCAAEPEPPPDDEGSTEPVVISEETLDFGETLMARTFEDGWTAYRFTADQGAVVSIAAEATPHVLPEGNWPERDCEDRYAVHPVILLRGPLDGGVFHYDTARLSDSIDHASCDLDAHIQVVFPEAGTYQVLAIDMQERAGRFELALGCNSQGCAPSCAGGCPEGSACTGDGLCVAALGD